MVSKCSYFNWLFKSSKKAFHDSRFSGRRLIFLWAISYSSEKWSWTSGCWIYQTVNVNRNLSNSVPNCNEPTPPFILSTFRGIGSGSCAPWLILFAHWNSKVSNLSRSVFIGSFIVPKETPSSSSPAGVMLLFAGDARGTAKPESSWSKMSLEPRFLLLSENWNWGLTWFDENDSFGLTTPFICKKSCLLHTVAMADETEISGKWFLLAGIFS